ncbi:hypothetical protein [Micromonospora sp. Mcm103]|uniref:hypothetical protein n=1 Tax=Micromonospora sp. Mcm103 TaxID=2926015 RepID=UPI0021CA5ACC|nr:hypothetical protein [Micromonospora sp. Mcm103]
MLLDRGDLCRELLVSGGEGLGRQLAGCLDPGKLTGAAPRRGVNELRQRQVRSRSRWACGRCARLPEVVPTDTARPSQRRLDVLRDRPYALIMMLNASCI